MLPPKGGEQVGFQRDAPTYDRWACVVHCGTMQAWHIGAGPWTWSKGHGPAGACLAGVHVALPQLCVAAVGSLAQIGGQVDEGAREDEEEVWKR